MTRPRRAANQRLATTAPSTSAVRPVPMPSSRLHSKNRCHSCVACVTIAMAPPTRARPMHITARSPKRSIITAANGPSRPNSAKRSARLLDICSVLQPNSRDSGCRSEEHTSELQSPCNLVCRLLLEKKKTDPNAAQDADVHEHAHPAPDDAQRVVEPVEQPSRLVPCVELQAHLSLGDAGRIEQLSSL